MITWRISARAEISTRLTGLKFCCDYIANFSPGWNIILVSAPNMKLRAKSLGRIRQPYYFLLFSPGWNFFSITWDFFSPGRNSARAESPNPVWPNHFKKNQIGIDSHTTPIFHTFFIRIRGGRLWCFLGFGPLGQNPAGAIISIWHSQFIFDRHKLQWI